MKVIKTGAKPEDREWRGTCRSCNAEATATENEMKHITYDQREGGSFSWEKCPVCNAGGSSGFGGMLFYPARASTKKHDGPCWRNSHADCGC